MKGILFVALLTAVLAISGCVEEVCGTHTETYNTNTPGCDNMGNCECLHKSWGGMGACDSCVCTREVNNC